MSKRITRKVRGKSLILKPHRASPINHWTSGDSRVKAAWFYENAGSVDVCIQVEKTGAVVCARLSRRKLEQWIRRTA